jgi:molybdopterin-containing oxidoreductase family iron-sulfur binding subunit
MTGSRRDFLKAAGITAIGGAGLGIGGLRVARAEDHAAEAAASGTRWAMAIDLDRWIRDENRERCFDACHMAHNVPNLVGAGSPLPEAEQDEKHEIKWIWEVEYESAFPMQYHETLAEKFRHAGIPVLCNHCHNAPCVRVCPTQATWRREDGIVMMDMHRCIGCRYCIIACPYGSRSFNFRDPRDGLREINQAYPTRMRGVVEKCSFCAHKPEDNRTPECVRACTSGALTFGDINDPDSPVRRALRDRYSLRRKPLLGTEPHVFYIV